MTLSLQFLRQYCRIFQGDAAKTRIYFPDQKVKLWQRVELPFDTGRPYECSYNSLIKIYFSNCNGVTNKIALNLKIERNKACKISF